MDFITHSFLLKALGSALIDSLWQMCALWLIYNIITANNTRYTAGQKHVLSLVLLLAGAGWFLFTWINAWSGSSGSHSFAEAWLADPRDAMMAGLSGFRRIWILAYPLLSSFYLLMLAFLVLRHLGLYVHLNKLRSEGLQKVRPTLRLFTESMAARLGIHKKVTVWLSDRVESPLTLGFLRPVILMPIATINHLTTDQVEAILLHELAHIRRNDYLNNLIISWLDMVFFFNPFSRLFIKTIRREREHCCDDLVMQFHYDPHAYGTALWSLEKNRYSGAGLALAATGRSRALLLERVKRITGHPINKNKGSLVTRLVLLAGLLGAQLIVPGFMAVNKPMTSPGQKRDPATIEVSGFRTVEVTFSPSPENVTMKKARGSVNESRSQKKKFQAPDVQQWIAEPLRLNLRDENPVLPAALREVRAYSNESGSALHLVAPDPELMQYPYVPAYSFDFRGNDNNPAGMASAMQLQGESYAEIISYLKKALASMERKEISKGKKGIPEPPPAQKILVQLDKSLDALVQADDQTYRVASADTEKQRILQAIRLRLNALKALEWQYKVRNDQGEKGIILYQIPQADDSSANIHGISPATNLKTIVYF